jgi:alanine racemase
VKDNDKEHRMAFTLRIDSEKWHNHLTSVFKSITVASGMSPVPVIKGNGYGLGQELLATEAMNLGADTIAVGTVFEIESIASVTEGDIIVLEPFDQRDAVASARWWEIGQKFYSGRIIRTVATPEALHQLLDGPGAVRIILEAHSSMSRFGFSEGELLGALNHDKVRHAMATGRIFVEGLSIHLPLERSAPDAHAHEVMRWAGLWQTETAVWEGHSPPAPIVWVSHCSDTELALIRASLREVSVRMRTGTRLWLGDRRVFNATATVLAVHPLSEGMKVGYRQRSGPKESSVVVLSGGTAHGIGLMAPSPSTSIRQKVISLGTGVLDATGRALSPFYIGGKQRWFVEPPHQHVSMVWLPNSSPLPRIGDQVRTEVRFTTSRFDSVELI